MEISGAVFKIGDVITGQGANGNWYKQEFVLDIVEDRYPKKVCLSVWGDKMVEEVKKIKVGDNVKVSFDVSSREYNDRWFTELRAWRIEAGGGPSAPSQSPPTYTTNSAPATPSAPSAAPAAASEEGDDLPF